MQTERNCDDGYRLAKPSPWLSGSITFATSNIQRFGDVQANGNWYDFISDPDPDSQYVCISRDPKIGHD
jgi:hypothetical protein